MEIRRTANAGVLLKLDGLSLLLDGVCREVSPYPATPEEERIRLLQSCPDILAFSHTHLDHCDPAFASAWQKQTGRVILCPGEIPDCRTSSKIFHRREITIIPIETRHIGKTEPGLRHCSYVIRGSRCVWFLGDASPLQWKGRKGREELPAPDVLICPYAYASTPAAWQITGSLGAKEILILHLPDRQTDPFGLWMQVENTAGDVVKILEMGESICL